MKQKVVIIGGVAAGPKIAAKLLRTTKFSSEVHLYTDEDMISYSACGMPYYIEGLIENSERLKVRTPEQFEAKGAHIHLNKRCIKILPQEKSVLIKDLKTEEIEKVQYDKLAVTTGAKPFIPQIENIHLKNIFTLRTLQDAVDIKNKMQESKRAVIVGAGYIGIEVLEAFAANNLHVTIIERTEQILPVFDREIADMIKEQILELSKEKGNVEIVTDETVVAFQGEEKVERVVGASGRVFETDLVVIAVGIIQNTQIAKDAGIELGVNNAIRVNNRMETSIKDIFAAGDCAESYNIISKQYVWIPLGSTANKEGRCAAINIAGDYDIFPGVLGSAVTRFMNLNMSLTGLTEKEAKKYGFDVVTASTSQKDKAGYMPTAETITMKLVVDRRTEKILGAQAIGCGDADKRINTVASAIYADQTVNDLYNLDMTYAPPYSTAVDPIHSLSMVIYNKLRK
jgi:NADPH-dependent 2,4-dienoyl-CoA reductase/sulfur reductase-like enzyme